MKKFPLGLAALAATALLLASCSGSDVLDPAEADQERHASTGENSSASKDSSPEDVETGEALGTVRINDFTTYTITELRNCEPLSDGTIERELELQGFGQHEGTPVQIDVYKQMVAGNAGNEVSWSGPEGVFGSSGSAQVTWGPDNASVLGSATLVDAQTQTEKIMLNFDLQVPAETVACR